MIKKLLYLTICLISAISIYSQSSQLTLNSSNSTLNSNFAWAKNTALGFVLTSKPGCIIPSYSAAMDTKQFCTRDVAHQLVGGYLLGLTNENYSMMNTFAWGANRRHAPNSTDYYWPRWHYYYNIDPLIQETNNGVQFGSCQWRTLPTAFDMAWRCYNQYLWTNDPKWISGEFFEFYNHLHDFSEGFMLYQDFNFDKIADEEIQHSSYFEFPDPDIQNISSGDALGTQYQALLSMAAILSKKELFSESEEFLEKAKYLRSFFETYHYDTISGLYVNGVDRYTNGQINWGKEASFFIPMTLIGDQGLRTETYLNFIDSSITAQNQTSNPLNIEAQTYLPETFYNHGKNDLGWKYLNNILKSHSTYPEVSFTCISSIISGMMGVDPDGPDSILGTIPRLKIPDVSWIELNHLPFAGRDIYIKHDGNTKTTITLNTGEPFKWHAQFYGNYTQLNVNGVPKDALVIYLNGKTISYVEVPISSGQTATVETIGSVGNNLPVLDATELTITPQGDQLVPGLYDLTDLTWVYGKGRMNDKVNIDRNYDGNDITIGDKYYGKGLGIRDQSSIRYELNQHYIRLLCDVGYNKNNSPGGPVEFVVYGGIKKSKKLLSTGTIKPGDGKKQISVDITGCQYIVLGTRRVSYNTEVGKVNWGNPKLVAKGTLVDEVPPTKPLNLIVNGVSSSTISLKWEAGTDNVAITEYQVYCNGVYKGSSNELSFTVKNLSSDSEYSLFVKSSDLFGNISPESNIVSAKTDPPQPITYLSEIVWCNSKLGYGTIHIDESIDGHTISVAGTKFTKGIGTHAPSEIVYCLDKIYSGFKCVVGVDDEVGSAGSVVFEVYGDNVLMTKTKVLYKGDSIHINLNVSEVNELKLVASDGGDGINSDHADWADAVLLYDPTGIHESEEPSFSNISIFPNPANKETCISLSNTKDLQLSISIWTVQGNLVKKLVDEQNYSSGDQELYWQPENLANGTYIVKIISRNKVYTGKIILMP